MIHKMHYHPVIYHDFGLGKCSVTIFISYLAQTPFFFFTIEMGSDMATSDIIKSLPLFIN